MSAETGLGPGSSCVAASWVKAREYLYLGMQVDNHSRPTPLSRIFNTFAPWDGLQELGPGSYLHFLSFFSFFLGRFFSGPRLTTVFY